MTGLDLLEEEMKKRGCTSTQISSKAVAVVLDILANSENDYLKLQEVKSETATLLTRLRDLRLTVDLWQNREKREQRRFDEEKEEFYREKHSMDEYIAAFNSSLTEVETPDARDAIKAAQLFVNTVNVKTAYDNTAFIIGLSSILTRGGIDGVKELKKINKKFAGYCGEII